MSTSAERRAGQLGAIIYYIVDVHLSLSEV
jgi:hypothetical protein